MIRCDKKQKTELTLFILILNSQS